MLFRKIFEEIWDSSKS